MRDTGADAEDDPASERRARRNVVVLAVAEALYRSVGAILIAVGGLSGHMLADDKSLATLPITTYVLGTATITMPASFAMRMLGRRVGFLIGASFGMAGTSLAAYAIYVQNFWLFCLATSLVGGYQAFSQYHRFAATDTASAAFRPKAVAWVLVGGLLAAVLGPQIVIYTKELFAPVLFAGSFAVAALVCMASMGVIAWLDIPKPPRRGEGGQAPRPLLEILSQPRLIIAIFCGMVSYAVMNFVMTATPLAMVACDHPISAAAHAIQWHLVAMFAPGFFTGHLIARFGREPVVLAGLALFVASGLVALSGLAEWQFNLALILLGLGWNFSFVGATTMVTDCHRPEERNKVQAVNEFLIFGLVALGAFSSGKIMHAFGWASISYTVFPLVAVAALLVVLAMVRGRTWRVAT